MSNPRQVNRWLRADWVTHTGRVNEHDGDEPAATEDETRAALLARSKRDFAPINKLFVQAARTSPCRHGPLAEFVRNRDLRGLRAYLLLLGITSSGDGQDGWSTTLPVGVWARAFDTTRGATPASAATAVSKVLTRLEQRRLIDRKRRGRERKIRVTLLREDGSGNAYTRPGKGNTDRFFRLSHRFWLDGWYERLDLPATAMLLVALHEKHNFESPDRASPRVVRVVGGHRRAGSGHARRGRPADSHHPAEEGPAEPDRTDQGQSVPAA